MGKKVLAAATKRMQASSLLKDRGQGGGSQVNGQREKIPGRWLSVHVCVCLCGRKLDDWTERKTRQAGK